MPIYEYECRRCGHRFELIQKFSDKPRRRCPKCSGRVDRLISPPAIRFKGSGWYVTDYAGKGKAEKVESEESAAGDAERRKAKAEKESEPPADKRETKAKGKKAS